MMFFDNSISSDSVDCMLLLVDVCMAFCSVVRSPNNVTVWRSGSVVRHMNEVALRWAG